MEPLLFSQAPFERRKADNIPSPPNVKKFARGSRISSGTIFQCGKKKTLHFDIHKVDLHAVFKLSGSDAGVSREILGISGRESCAAEEESQYPILGKYELQHVVQAKTDLGIPDGNHTAGIGTKHGKLFFCDSPMFQKY